MHISQKIGLKRLKRKKIAARRKRADLVQRLFKRLSPTRKAAKIFEHKQAKKAKKKAREDIRKQLDHKEELTGVTSTQND